jgi:repressor LexA
MALSDRQQRMYDFISGFTQDRGRPPTIREIATQVGISSTSVVNYNLNVLAKEGFISRDKEIARGLHMLRPSASKRPAHVVQVPLLGVISAGQPIPVPDVGTFCDGEVISLTPEVLQEQPGLFALRVKGHSMIDALINDGDIVVMKAQTGVENGDMVAVWLKAEKETTLKRFYRETGRVRLQPMNPTMRPFYVKPSNVEIQGRVVLVVRQS